MKLRWQVIEARSEIVLPGPTVPVSVAQIEWRLDRAYLKVPKPRSIQAKQAGEIRHMVQMRAIAVRTVAVLS